MFDVSVIICTYNPVYSLYVKTLKSIISQKNVNFEVVICDDGSKNDCFEEVKQFFLNNSFDNYKLIKNIENIGTVKNLITGFKNASGKYVKAISPGDFLFDDYTLNKMYSYAEKNGNGLFFGEAIYYSFNDNILTIHNKRDPVLLEPYIKQNYKEIRNNYFIHYDFILGASLFVNTELFLNGLEIIQNYVKYAEDYSLMYHLLKGEKIFYMDFPIIWYEFGGGISTNGDSFWGKTLRKDYDNIMNFLLEQKLFSFIERNCWLGKNILIKKIVRKLVYNPEKRNVKFEKKLEEYEKNRFLEFLMEVE